MSTLKKGELVEWVLDPKRNYYSGLGVDELAPKLKEPPKPRPIVRPVPQSYKCIIDLGDLGEQDCNVLYLRNSDGVEVQSASWRGTVLTGDLLPGVLDEIGSEILESLSDE